MADNLVENTPFNLAQSLVPNVSTTANLGGNSSNLICIDEMSNWEYDASTSELLDLYIQGKDLLKNKDEYLAVILRLPFVKKDNLVALEVYERLRFLHDTLKGKKK